MQVCLTDGLQPLQTLSNDPNSVLKTMPERIGREKRGMNAPPNGPRSWYLASLQPYAIYAINPQPPGCIRSQQVTFRSTRGPL